MLTAHQVPHAACDMGHFAESSWPSSEGAANAIPFFSEHKLEAQRGKVTDLRSQSQKVEEPRVKVRSA